MNLAVMKPLVYVAGPYTRPDPIENTHNLCKIGSRLVEDGKVTPVIPHLSMLWHLVDPHQYQWWLDYDLEVLDHCDAVLRIPGESSGADGEVEYARHVWIPVFDTIEDLYAWADTLATMGRSS